MTLSRYKKPQSPEKAVASAQAAMTIGYKSLADGAAVTWNCQGLIQRLDDWECGTATVALTMSNFRIPGVYDVLIKKTIAGDVTITLSGSGLTFRGFDDGGFAATPDVVLSGATDDFFELSIRTSTQVVSGNNVAAVSLREKGN